MRPLKKLKKTTSSDRQESFKPLFKRRKGKRKVGTKIQTDFDKLLHKVGNPVQKEFKISLFKSLSSEKNRQCPKCAPTSSKVEFNPYRNTKLGMPQGWPIYFRWIWKCMSIQNRLLSVGKYANASLLLILTRKAMKTVTHLFLWMIWNLRKNF